MPSDRQTTDRETFWAAHAEHGGMWRDLGTETGLVVDCCRCGLCHVVSGGEPASHRQTEIDRIFRAEADRYLAMADEERDNPYERHAYLKARHAEQMLHYAVAAAVEAELSRVQQERDEALAVLAPNMPGSGLVDACRQVKQVAISEAGNSSDWMTRAEKAEAERDALQQEIATLRQQIGDVAERLAGLQEGDSRSPDWYHAASIAEEWVRALLQKGQ